MEELQKIVDSLVAEKSLSFEVLEQLKKVRDESVLAQEEIKTHKEVIHFKNEKITEMKADVDSKVAEIDRLKARIVIYEIREKNFNESEHNMALLQKDVYSSDRALNEVKSVVSMVFKNPIIRESTYKSKQIPIQSNGYVNTYSETDSTTVTTEVD